LDKVCTSLLSSSFISPRPPTSHVLRTPPCGARKHTSDSAIVEHVAPSQMSGEHCDTVVKLAQRNAGTDRDIHLAQMVRELERRGAPHTQCSAPALTHLPSGPCSHVVKNCLEYAAVYFFPIQDVSAQFCEPNFE
jgi:hypothetical protein